MSCLFCKIVAGEIPADILFEDDLVMAFRDISPQAPDHFLVIPKKHISTMFEVEEADTYLLGHIHFVAQKVAKELGHEELGCRVVMNCKENGGQTVGHIHLHTLAGRSLQWPPG